MHLCCAAVEGIEPIAMLLAAQRLADFKKCNVFLKYILQCRKYSKMQLLTNHADVISGFI